MSRGERPTVGAFALCSMPVYLLNGTPCKPTTQKALEPKNENSWAIQSAQDAPGHLITTAIVSVGYPFRLESVKWIGKHITISLTPSGIQHILELYCLIFFIVLGSVNGFGEL